MKRWVLVSIAVYLAASLALAAWLLPTGREQPPSPFAAPLARHVWPLDAAAPEAARSAALHQARVWMPVDVAAADLGVNPADPAGTLSDPIVRCRYLDGPAHGTTAKFDCVLRDGEVVKVKYGHTGEIHAELAASRLLTALGFGADRMFLIPRVRCYGCVRTPFYTNWALDKVQARALVARSVPEDSYTDFEWAATPTSSGRPSSGTSEACRSRLVRAKAGRGSSWIRSTPRSAPAAPSGTRSASPPCCSRTGTTRRRTSASCASHPRPRRRPPAPARSP